MALETTTSFYNESTFGGNFQSDINTALYTTFPELQWDTWITIGDDFENAPSTIGELNIDGINNNSWIFLWLTFLIVPESFLRICKSTLKEFLLIMIKMFNKTDLQKRKRIN